jgi:lysophospholipase L1-like esterase
MKVSAAELRFAWLLLATLAYIASAGPTPGALSLLLMALAFVLGGVVLCTAKGAARAADGLERLLSGPNGRLSLVGAVVLTILIGFTFSPFAGFVLAGLFCSIAWTADLIFGSSRWEERLSQWTALGLSLFVALAAADRLLNWGPIARQLGTPAELAQWPYRYKGLGTRNFLGFRSRYEDTRRRPAVRRIVALGDSFTWGSKIAPADSTWPALLEHILTQPPDGMPTEVVNMGRGGFATGNETEMLRRIGWQFHPDLVILQWLDNDAYVTLPNFGAVEVVPREGVVLIPDAFRGGWIYHSALLALAEGILNARFFNVLDVNRKHYAPNYPGFLEQQRDFREMGDSAARKCVPALLVLYPYLFPGEWTEATYPEQEIHQRVAAAGRSAGLEVFDLLPTFVAASKGRNWKSWWGTAYDSHPGSDAQLVAANAIAGFVQEHHLLADSSVRANHCRR